MELDDSKPDKAKDVDFERYMEYTNHGLGISVFLLTNLYTWKQDGKRIGRKALYTYARESGYTISEHEVRYVLLQMESFGYVKILKGRGGTVITPLGFNALNYFKQCI